MVCKANAGRLKQFLKEWENITKDRYILNVIRGFKIPFKSLPIQINEPGIGNYSDEEKHLIDESIVKLLSTGAVVNSQDEEGQFVSRIFTVPKPDGSRRPIINLKYLNSFIDNPHFKMESIKTAMSLLSENCFMAVIDLKDAYHAIRIDDEFQKFLKFRWNGKLYKYTCLPFGLCLAPWLYTKLNKPIVSYLRSQGVILVSYLDNTMIIGRNFHELKYGLELTLDLFRKLGLIVNVEKSQLNPSTCVRFLGFELNSKSMQITLPVEKRQKVLRKCSDILNNPNPTLLSLAELIGTLVTASPATRYGMLYTRQLEVEKTRALIGTSGLYVGRASLSQEAQDDIKWWIIHLDSEYHSLKSFKPTYEIFTDASLKGWGAVVNGVEARGNWTIADFMELGQGAQIHINTLELQAAFNGLKSLVKGSNHDILLRVDSSNAMVYINNFGGCHSRQQHMVAKNIWKWCESKNIIIQSTYVNTKENVVADKLSRTKVDNSDFMLSPSYFSVICRKFGIPEIDLFATYQTKQCDRYFSWKADPMSEGIDAFTQNWDCKFYAFPPLNLIGKTLNKILNDKVEGIIVAPYWTTQSWYPLFQKLAITKILFFGPNNKLLLNPYSREYHQINKSLKLMVAILSGKHCQDSNYQIQQFQ